MDQSLLKTGLLVTGSDLTARLGPHSADPQSAALVWLQVVLELNLPSKFHVFQ